MKYFELDKEEKNILADFDNNEFVSVRKIKAIKKEYEQYAAITLGKSRNVNIRLSQKDLQKIKAKAIDKGIPYQTLITSVIHQYVNDRVEVEI